MAVYAEAMKLPTDEIIEQSRQRLNLPDDWEWYTCENGCGDIVWLPPGAGDVPGGAPLCSPACMAEFLLKKEGRVQ